MNASNGRHDWEVKVRSRLLRKQLDRHQEELKRLKPAHERRTVITGPKYSESGVRIHG